MRREQAGGNPARETGDSPRPRRRSAGLRALLAAGLMLWCAAACAQQRPVLLIISTPGGKTNGGEYVDLAPYLQRTLNESGRFEIVLFKPSLPAVRAALDAKELSNRDLMPPVSKEAGHRIGRAIGADLLLRVSARYSTEGVSAETEMETRSGQNQWNTLFTQSLAPHKVKRSGPTAGILAQSAAITERILGAPDRAANHTTKKPNGNEPGKAETGSKPETPNKAEGSTPAGPKPPTDNAVTTRPPAIPAGPSPAELMIERARRNGDMPGLIVALRRAINEKPRSVELRRDLAEAYHQRGWSQASRDEAMRAIALMPNDPALHRLLGDACMDEGDTEGALREYQEAVRLNPHEAAGLVALGDAWWNAAKPDDAQKCYTEAAQAEPKNPLPLRRLARLLVQRGRYAEAVTALKSALACTAPEEMDPFNADFAALLSVVETGLNDGLMKMQGVRKAFADGTRNREQTFKDLTDLKQRAEALSSFLGELPDTPFSRVQALYLQGAAQVVQTYESALEYLESGSTSRDEETGLLRLEALKQIADASKKLKALTAPKK